MPPCPVNIVVSRVISDGSENATPINRYLGLDIMFLLLKSRYQGDNG